MLNDRIFFKILIESSQEEEEEDEEDEGGTSYQFENELENQALDSQANEEEEPDSYVLVQVSISFVVFKLQLQYTLSTQQRTYDTS